MSQSTAGQPMGRRELAALSLAALGVVYGDIGTSPLYALKECFGGHHSVPPTPENVLGVLSLVFWSINFVVSFKYITFVMRCDNRGEGGILALLALVRPREARVGPRGETAERRNRGNLALVALGLFGAALLYGDGVITPAVSVLGALEGLSVATPIFDRWVVWIAVVILLGLFVIQKFGTAGIGRLFGPVMLVWFACIAVLGVRGILLDPSVLRAANPWYAYDFFVRDGREGFLILGSVVLVITGGEALYADMGHFGKRPIRIAWFTVALPALLLNYFGQAALLLHDPTAARNPFYSLVPGWALYPMVVVGTMAAIVASQALISGAFSLTRQAVQLGYSPRVTIRHTSSTEAGQIYIPEVNTALAVGCILLVIGFRNSTNLAAAYGIAVTGTMIITTLLFHTVVKDHWRWPDWTSYALAGLFLVVDVAFFAANLIKIEEGGWFPLAVAAVIYALMTTWRRGRQVLAETMREGAIPMPLFLADIQANPPVRVPGTAVFLTGDPSGAPPVLLHHLKHNKVLHQQVLILSIVTEEIPQVPEEDRIFCTALGSGLYQVIAHYGFMETPDVPRIMQALGDSPQDPDIHPVKVQLAQTSFYLGRETLIPGTSTRMAYWRKRLFILMTRNAKSATAFFRIPPNRVVELGAQIQL